MDLNNQKRLIASQIIVELYEEDKSDQLKILKVQIDAALMRLEGPKNGNGQ